MVPNTPVNYVVSTWTRGGCRSRVVEVLLHSSPDDSFLVSETQGAVVVTTNLNLYASHDVHLSPNCPYGYRCLVLSSEWSLFGKAE